jgi:hypothetical protein
VATATGTNLGTATLEWIGRAEGSTAPKTLYSISLTEVPITNWEQSTDSKGPQEVLSLAFRLLRMQVPIVKPENEPPASSSTIRVRRVTPADMLPPTRDRGVRSDIPRPTKRGGTGAFAPWLDFATDPVYRKDTRSLEI